VTIYRIGLQCQSPSIKESEKLIEGRSLPTSYHVWSTSVNAFVSYPAAAETERTNDRMSERRIT